MSIEEAKYLIVRVGDWGIYRDRTNKWSPIHQPQEPFCNTIITGFTITAMIDSQ